MINNLTEEERQELIDECKYDISILEDNLKIFYKAGCPAAAGEYKNKLERQKIALAALTAEPVAIVEISRCSYDRGSKIIDYIPEDIQHLPVNTNLYTAPLAPLPAIPDGWKLVPMEPTQYMVDAHIEGVQYGGFQCGYRNMLSAAPSPEEGE